MEAAMRRESDATRDWFDAYLPIGVFGSVALGVFLILFRELTSASNLAFVFLAWTIVIAELGGRPAALATAVASALSLNFFLTRPYLTLRIADQHDVIAFVALAACGLIAASFGRRRRASAVAVREVRADLDTIGGIVRLLRTDGRRDGRLASAVEQLRQAFRLGAVVLRDGSGRIVAAATGDPAREPGSASVELDPDTLLVTGEKVHRFGERGLRLPEGGGRLPLVIWGEPVGRLEVWEGDPAGLDPDECRSLSIIASLIAARLAGRRTA
jgi:K+-sensing histidine kinase KdpD